MRIGIFAIIKDLNTTITLVLPYLSVHAHDAGYDEPTRARPLITTRQMKFRTGHSFIRLSTQAGFIPVLSFSHQPP